MKFFNIFLLLAISVFIISCKDEDDDNTLTVNHPNTYQEGEEGFKFYIGEELFEGNVFISNSLDINKSIPLSFGFNNDFDFAAFNWLPNKVGTYEGGYNLGAGNSNNGEDLYFNGHFKNNGDKYYFFSSSPYAHNESVRVSGSFFKMKISKLDGGYVRYRYMNYNITGFIGVMTGEFAGTLVNKSGDKIEITKGEFRFEEQLPNGAELLE